ncbi:hypothetical protein CHU92_12155 [Flavobacterium cyanobacteriorum]|uniref:Cell surface protein n=1 Tax=Flavobacterium cyanobacteriorum TaxID=2022802 RepID=A0A255YY04_9FLAO|nr:DUF5074 domain-containing protein [Flavobacterium cyanobacteriorum]OYQ34082.1 hypothetical protein CHU92_12155 [Flavobacterium cyanobacteriorum]
MKLNKLLLTAFALSVLFTSCSDDDNALPAPSGAYEGGMLILNQGGFNAGNASVSFMGNNAAVENNIFSSVNSGMLLGDTAQDIGLEGDRAYIVVNNSHKIEVVNRYTFRHIATIQTGLSNPRYIAFANGRGYVTNWGNGSSTTDDYIAVVDLASNSVVSSIPVAEGPERILAYNNKLYVAHKGGWGYGNSITVINAANNTVATSITVGYVPEGMEIADGKLYVLGGGVPSWAGTLPESTGSLYIISLGSDTVVSTMVFSGMLHPNNLDIEQGSLYYTAGSDVYKMDVAATSFPSSALFNITQQGVYGVSAFAVRNSRIYIGDAADYSSNGKVYVHNLTGAPETSFTVGVVPAGFYFN